MFLKEGLAHTTQNGNVDLKDMIIPLIRVDSSFSNNLIGIED